MAQHLVFKEALQPIPLIIAEVERIDHHHVITRQFGDNVLINGFELYGQILHFLLDLFEQLFGIIGTFIITRVHMDHDLAFHIRHPHPEKFVEVVGVNTQKTDALNNRVVAISRFLQDALIKRQPA